MHWLLIDSLEIYFVLRDEFYLGPKKSLKLMQDKNPHHYSSYTQALEKLTYENLKQWIKCVESTCE